MPTYIIEGKRVVAEGPLTEAEIDEIGTQVRAQGAAPAGAEKSGFFSSVANTAGTLGSGLSAMGFAAASPEDQEQARQKLIDDETPEGIGTAFADIKDASSAWDWFKQTAGSSLGFLVAPGAAATAAGVAKLPFLPAKAVGYGTLGAQYLITNLTRQAQEQKAAIEAGESPNTTDLGKAIIASAAQTGLDVLQFGTVFKPIVSKFPVLGKLIGNEGAEVAKRTEKELIKALDAGEFSVSGGIARGMLAGAAFEIPQEIAQQMLERWQSDQPLTGEDAAQEYLEAGVGALALGGSMGALSGFIDTASKKAEAQQAKDDEFAGAQEEYNKEKDEAQRLAQEEADRKAELDALSKDAPEGQLKGTEALADLIEKAKAFVTTLPEAPEATWKAALSKQFPNLEPGYDTWILDQLKEQKLAYRTRGGIWGNGEKIPPAKEIKPETYLDLQKKANEFLKTLPAETDSGQWADALATEFGLHRKEAKGYAYRLLQDAVINEPDLFHRYGKRGLFGHGPKPKTNPFMDKKNQILETYDQALAAMPVSDRAFHTEERKKLSSAATPVALDKAVASLKPIMDKYAEHTVDAKKVREETKKEINPLINRAKSDPEFAKLVGPKIKAIIDKVTPLYRGTAKNEPLLWHPDEEAAHQEVVATDIPALKQAVTAYDEKAKADKDAAATAAKTQRQAEIDAERAKKKTEREERQKAAEATKAANKKKAEADKAAAKTQRDARQQTAVTNVLTAFTSNPEFADRSKAIALTATKIAEITGLNRMTEAPAVLSALHKAGHIEKSTTGKGYSIPAKKEGKSDAKSVKPDNGTNGATAGAGATRTARKKSAKKQGTQEAGTAGVDATVASPTGANAGKAADGSPLKPKTPKPPKPPKPPKNAEGKPAARSAEDIKKEGEELYKADHLSLTQATALERYLKNKEFDKAEGILRQGRRDRELMQQAAAEAAASEVDSSYDEDTAETAEKEEIRKAAEAVDSRKAKPLADTMRDRASDAEVRTVERAVDKSMGDLALFLKNLAESTPEQLYSYLSQVLGDRVRELQKLGVRMDIEITDTIRDDDGKNDKNFRGVSRAYVSSKERGMVNRVNVELRTNVNDAISTKEGVGVDGRNYLTALHESTHAVTQGFLNAPEYMLSEKTLQAKRELEGVLKKAKAAVERLAKKQRFKLTATEEAAVQLYETSNAFTDVDELVTQTLTNYDMQRFLNEIKYPAKGGWRTLFNDFISAIKTLIGFKVNDDSALLAVIKSTSVIMEADVREGYTSYTTDSIESSAAPMAVKRSKAKTFTPPPYRKESHHERARRKMGQTDAKAQREEGVREAGKALMTEKGFEEVVRKFQNDRRPLKQLQDFLEKAKKLVVTGDFNNLYDHITLSTGKAFNAMTEHLQGHMASLDRAVLKYAEARGISTNLALGYLQTYYEAKHEPERRLTKFMMNVPLNTKTVTQLDQNIIPQQSPLYNVKASAAELRERIIAELSTNKNLVSNGYAEKYREALKELIYRSPKTVTRADGSTYKVGTFMDNTVDGATTVKDKGVLVVNMPFDPVDRVYDVIGAYSQDQLQEDRDAYEKDPHKDMVDKIYKQMGFLQNATIRLDKESNYWSKPVDNIKEFYGWKNYIPMKGQAEKNAFVHASDARFEYNSRRLGAGFNDLGGEFGGRSTDSFNPVLQTMVDATKAALRYGRKDVTTALKNLINEKHIKGRPFASISFRDRYRSELAFDPTSDKFFFVYKPDGMIDIYEVTDDRMKEAIRRSYADQQPLVNLANNITGAIGHLHTRYNISFHPYNFVRDALTNAFTMGAEMGPMKAAKLIQAVAVRVGRSGAMSKAMKVSRLYAAGRVAEIRTMAKTDNFVKEVLEYLEEGGRISYIQGLSNKSQAQEMLKDIERGDFSRHKEVFDKWVDTWGDGFEFTSRAASYAVMKSEYMAQGMTEAEARTRAASYTKNLANFEQVGQYGRTMGAMYMFFRPAITGAVRAIDALKPAFQSVDSYLESVPESLRGDAEAMENLRKDHLTKQKNARHMVYSLLGMGATLYLMAMLASDDDEQERNKIQTDDMALWTRNIRLPLDMFGDKDSYLQLPWGFGLGAFGAMGAQVAGVAFGKTSIMEAMPNFISIALDSYMPIPFQRIDPKENFPAFAVGSMAPSLARPFLEWAMNVDSLGREIYNNRLNKYGDAFTGGANVPEAYRDLSRWLLKKSNVGIDVQPTTLQFWGNQYADGIARIGHGLYGLNQYFSGTKQLDVKADIPLVSSFIGRKSNYDGREFATIEKQLKEESARLTSLEFRPELYRRYVEDHPYMPAVVNHFNKISNNQLKDIRSLKKEIEASDLPANVRKEQLDALRVNENYIKRNLINMYRQYGVEP
jgi:hypothetical protein